MGLANELLQLHCVLIEKRDMWPCAFSVQPYKDVCDKLLHLIEQIDGDEYYGPKLHHNLKWWAKHGR